MTRLVPLFGSGIILESTLFSLGELANCSSLEQILLWFGFSELFEGKMKWEVYV